MLWYSVYLLYTGLLTKARTQVLCIADSYKFLIGLKVFSLFRLLENETLVFEKDAKADINLAELTFAKLSK